METWLEQYPSPLDLKSLNFMAGISYSTVARYLQRYRETGEVNTRKSPGRPRKLDERQSQQLSTVALANNFVPIVKLPSYCEPGFPSVSRSTLTRYLKKDGVMTRIAAEKPDLTAEAVRARLDNAR